MIRELTPWEKLDGIKHSLNFIGNSLDSIIEGVVEWERSRIIKLLEDNDEELIGIISDWFDYGLDHEAGRAYKNRAIALIKGEK